MITGFDLYDVYRKLALDCSETDHNKAVWERESPRYREKWEVEAARLNALERTKINVTNE